MVFNNSSSVESLLVQLVDEVSREDLYKTHVNVDENCILYHNVQYLGSTTLLNAPNQSLEQLQSCLLMLHEAASPTLKNTVDEMFTVTISINESTNGGSLRILDESTFGEIMKFEMTNVQRCFRGQTKESCLCVIILVSTPKPESTNDVTIYGFRFSSSNTAVQIIRYFSKIFKSSEPCDEGLRCDSTDQNSHNFRLSFDIKELDNKNVFMSVPRTRNVFRLRKDRCKRMMITIEKRSLSFLRIDRCFGVLLSHGVNVANHKMKLLDTISHEYDLKLNQLQLIAIWDQDLINLTWLDDLHCDSQLMHFTIALDLVFNDVIDPTRVKFEFITKVTRIAASANIVPSSAELASWYYSKKPLTCDFVVLTNRNQNEKSAKQYVVMRSCGAITTKSKEPNTLKCITSDIYNDIDSNEMDGVVLSGEGRTRKEYSRDTLQEWKLALHEWNVPNITPKSILKLIDEVIQHPGYHLLTSPLSMSTVKCNWHIQMAKKFPIV
ncbi:hypothetical protein GJ496_002989 [Pomphorhynchus laevis]|nr:hypothetical protein GJ496_002989 [Pomphorhynchus laevis]